MSGDDMVDSLAVKMGELRDSIYSQFGREFQAPTRQFFRGMMMLIINDRLRIPDHELSWTFVRSGGPGGQNVNKVASKAVMRWDVAGSPSLPEDVKIRFRSQQRGRITTEGVLVLSSQRYRDQERNRQDCLDKLRAMILSAATLPKRRRPTKKTRGSQERRLQAKKRRAAIKTGRRGPAAE
jgi:ribosome-associated protein